MLKTQLETDVTEYYRSVYQKIINVETEELDEIFDDDFVLEKISGDTSSKDEFLGELKDESLRIYSENVERIYVKKDGDILNVRGRSKVNISENGAKRRIRKIQVDFVLKKVSEGMDPETGDPDPSKTKWRILGAKTAIY